MVNSELIGTGPENELCLELAAVVISNIDKDEYCPDPLFNSCQSVFFPACNGGGSGRDVDTLNKFAKSPAVNNSFKKPLNRPSCFLHLPK